MKQSSLDDFNHIPWALRECLDEGSCKCRVCLELRAIWGEE